MKMSLLVAVAAVIDLLAAWLLLTVGFGGLAIAMFAIAVAGGAFAFVQWRRGN